MDKLKASKIFSQHGRNMPKRIFAKWEWDRSEPWLEAAEDTEALAEKGETVFVGEYQLVQVRKIELKVQTTSPKVRG